MTAKAKKGLTAAFVRTVSEPGRYGDALGLNLVVSPAGAKRWIQRITIRGKRVDLGLGPLAAVSLAEARELAAKNFREARTGGDPLRAKREAQAAMTFEEAARAVHESYLPTWRSAKHGQDFLSSLQMHAFDRIGALKVQDVTPADVLAVLSPIWTAKPETARRVRQRIGTVMEWAVAKGWRQDNPAASISKALPKVPRLKAHRVALPYAEVSTYLEALAASGAGPSTKQALEFLILTAARSIEAREARWSEIDMDAKVWTVPAQRMKMKRDHKVPLSPRAMAILREAAAHKRNSEPDPFLFPGLKAGRPLSDVALSKLTKALGFPVDVHGFRTSFRTWAQEKTTAAHEVAEAALAHTVGNSVSQAYARSDMFEKRRDLMDRWAGYLAGAEGKVIRLRQ
ncbi:site-specific integrase [Pararhodobacter sp. CCB-MM2]|uniref:tyrosine-type recombinase/integrase n=1 Tax=Pararhodobacter sp. CCB-MM2 TaxID=1786003 RepID=UPI00082B6A55|nr:site-specific integrase [Pararhodobacter sp. CCB-MM2]